MANHSGSGVASLHRLVGYNLGLPIWLDCKGQWNHVFTTSIQLNKLVSHSQTTFSSFIFGQEDFFLSEYKRRKSSLATQDYNKLHCWSTLVIDFMHFTSNHLHYSLVKSIKCIVNYTEHYRCTCLTSGCCFCSLL